MSDLDFAKAIEPVARQLCGEVNLRLSSSTELRFGSHGSLSVKIGGDGAGTWHDHEALTGGGVLDLIAHRRGGDRKAAAEWLRSTFPDFSGEDRPAQAPASRRIVATYRYDDEFGRSLFEVVRYDPK
ncbi:MAG: hypothetical protein ACREDP_23955, partial [Bradyrhizobium sp.]